MYSRFLICSLIAGLCIRLLLGLFLDVYGYWNREDIRVQIFSLEREIEQIGTVTEQIRQDIDSMLFDEIVSFGVVEESARVFPHLYDQGKVFHPLPNAVSISKPHTSYRLLLQNVFWISSILVFVVLCIVEERSKRVEASLSVPREDISIANPSETKIS